MMLSVGYKNSVDITSIVEILRPNNAPAKKMRRKAIEGEMFINVTNGKKAKSLIIMKSNHVVLSALRPGTIGLRLERIRSKQELLPNQLLNR
jgi:regulator of extracellular matrix RemA (YlzA/DUF370 family)